jgi:NAD(P)-dependent dehydrogenase (short-subunit alcohol dehydrogenase family)
MECARLLSKHGAELILIGRGGACGKVQRLLEELTINALYSGCAAPQSIECDLSSITSVREAARRVVATQPWLDCLMNNGGVSCCPPQLSADGFELQCAVNAVSHFVLTSLLFPLLVKAKLSPARIICVSSKAHSLLGCFTPSQLNSLDNYGHLGGSHYALSKLCNILHCKALQRAIDGRESRRGKVVAFSLHPGGVSTGIVRHIMSPLVQRVVLGAVLRPFLKSVSQGAATQLLLVSAPASLLEPGGYYQDCQLGQSSVLSESEDAVEAFTKHMELCTTLKVCGD